MCLRDLARSKKNGKSFTSLSPLLFCLFIAACLLTLNLAAQGPAAANGVPHIDTVENEFGAIGETIIISGTNFGANRGDSYVSFGGAKATEYPSWSDLQIAVVVPRGLEEGEVNVQVTVVGSGTSNAVPFEVVPYAVGFSEGYTGDGFREFICLGNPNAYPAQADILYIFPEDQPLLDEMTIPAESRVTFDVNSIVGPGKEVSVAVLSDINIVVERPMYFNYSGAWSGGHDEMGTPYMSTLWFFAEGYTGAGFDEWICVLNLNENPANLSFYFQTKEEGEILKSESVPPYSRRSFKVNELLGPDYQCSLVLESDQMVIAERSMYFDYTGMGNHHWAGGHCVMGVPYLAREYYFAEGTTRPGFEEWITLQNPFNTAITVNATYQLAEGTPIMKSYVVPPLTRETLYIPDEVGVDKDVSVKLASGGDFLAERPMYFNYTGYGASWDGGHCVIGADELMEECVFAEGYTGPGFQEWLCLQNPGDEESLVEITYLTADLSPVVKTKGVPAKSRTTLYINEDAGSDRQISCIVKVLSGSTVVVERPMYFDFNGWGGGHDVVGFRPYSYQDASLFSSAGLQRMAPVGSIVCDVEEWRDR